MSKLEELSAAADKCFDECNDYSCVRTGSCTGHAGFLYDMERRRQEQEKKQKEEDQKLIEQIRRIKHLI